jgi:hypothetical protein
LPGTAVGAAGPRAQVCITSSVDGSCTLGQTSKYEAAVGGQVQHSRCWLLVQAAVAADKMDSEMM